MDFWRLKHIIGEEEMGARKRAKVEILGEKLILQNLSSNS
jgi:hypothetical protein